MGGWWGTADGGGRGPVVTVIGWAVVMTLALVAAAVVTVGGMQAGWAGEGAGQRRAASLA